MRGCGRRKPGYYLGQSEGSPDGTIKRFQWFFTNHVLEREDMNQFNMIYDWDNPPRGMSVASVVSFSEGRVVPFVKRSSMVDNVTQILGTPWFNPEHQNLVQKMLGFAEQGCVLFDHIGDEHYNPVSFADETTGSSASRRVSPKVVEFLTVNSLIPIRSFVTQKLPVFAERDAQHLLELANKAMSHYEWDFKFTHTNNLEDITSDYFMKYILRAMHDDYKRVDKGLREELKQGFADLAATEVESIFGVMYLDRILRVPGGDYDDIPGCELSPIGSYPGDIIVKPKEAM